MCILAAWELRTCYNMERIDRCFSTKRSAERRVQEFNVTAKAKVIEALQNLSEDDLLRVVGFLDNLESDRRQPRPGSPRSLLRAAGSWWMAEEETERFLTEVGAMRHSDDGGHALDREC